MAEMIEMRLRCWQQTEATHSTYFVEVDGIPALPHEPTCLYWRAPNSAQPAMPPVVDSFVAAVALPCAAIGGVLKVEGKMSRSGLYNVNRLLQVRQEMSPERYRPLRIEPESVVDLPSTLVGNRNAILAFSGGVDSTHAAWINAANGDAADRMRLTKLVLVHGFDAPLDRPDIFARMLERARPLAQHFGVELVGVETNAKSLSSYLWPHTATPLAAAAINLFWQEAPFGIFGGGFNYNSNFLAQGHQPYFDQYCSNDAFTLLTDAGGVTRTEKLRNIAADPAMLTGLRVCWEGSDVSRNCGRCEKCITTMLGMKVVGIDPRIAFDVDMDLALLLVQKQRTLYQVRDLGEMIWNDVKSDPRFVAEAAVVRQAIAMGEPTRPYKVLKENLLRNFFSREMQPVVRRYVNALRLRWRSVKKGAAGVAVIIGIAAYHLGPLTLESVAESSPSDDSPSPIYEHLPASADKEV